MTSHTPFFLDWNPLSFYSCVPSRTPRRSELIIATPLLAAEPLVVRIGGGNDELLGRRVENRLLGVARAVGQGRHLSLQGYRVFLLPHVGIDVQGNDLLGSGVK